MTAPGRGCNILFLFFFALIAMVIILWMIRGGTTSVELARAEGRRDANYGLISQLKSNKYEWEVTAAGGSCSSSAVLKLYICLHSALTSSAFPAHYTELNLAQVNLGNAPVD